MNVQDARQQTLGELLRRTARRDPDRLAIVCGDTRWTYAELDARCDALARALMRRGVAAGDRVAVLARNSHAFVALRFAVARAGAVLVPINFMLKPPEIAFILRNSGARILCTDSGLAEAARAWGGPGDEGRALRLAALGGRFGSGRRHGAPRRAPRGGRGRERSLPGAGGHAPPTDHVHERGRAGRTSRAARWRR